MVLVKMTRQEYSFQILTMGLALAIIQRITINGVMRVLNHGRLA